MPVEFAFALLLGILAALALAGGICALLLFERVRASDSEKAAELGTGGTISSGWRWTLFVWSSRPIEHSDPGIRRLVLILRLVHVLYLPLFLVVLGGFLLVTLETI